MRGGESPLALQLSAMTLGNTIVYGRYEWGPSN